MYYVYIFSNRYSVRPAHGESLPLDSDSDHLGFRCSLRRSAELDEAGVSTRSISGSAHFEHRALLTPNSKDNQKTNKITKTKT